MVAITGWAIGSLPADSETGDRNLRDAGSPHEKLARVVVPLRMIVKVLLM